MVSSSDVGAVGVAETVVVVGVVRLKTGTKAYSTCATKCSNQGPDVWVTYENKN